ncbi:type II toxin-antitoxin system Phd/YefM family antitoxin [Nocardioides sp. LS1]|uniref:type II toxin-antitoxin system Phd/YefM family antitoxin n=1 Tax=Nocardioides sp. LS1 TaxID=1027620 RepID=UPI0035A5F5B6
MRPLTEVRRRLGSFVDEVVATGSPLAIARHGKPAAVLMSTDDYDGLSWRQSTSSPTQTWPETCATLCVMSTPVARPATNKSSMRSLNDRDEAGHPVCRDDLGGPSRRVRRLAPSVWVVKGGRCDRWTGA